MIIITCVCMLNLGPVLLDCFRSVLIAYSYSGDEKMHILVLFTLCACTGWVIIRIYSRLFLLVSTTALIARMLISAVQPWYYIPETARYLEGL